MVDYHQKTEVDNREHIHDYLNIIHVHLTEQTLSYSAISR